MPCNNACLMGDICCKRYGGSRKPPCASQPEELSTTALDPGSLKLPTVEECICEVRRRMLGSEYSEGIPAMVTILHDFICRQLRAGA
jgi:hypothetical protein